LNSVSISGGGSSVEPAVCRMPRARSSPRAPRTVTRRESASILRSCRAASLLPPPPHEAVCVSSSAISLLLVAEEMKPSPLSSPLSSSLSSRTLLASCSTTMEHSLCIPNIHRAHTVQLIHAKLFRTPSHVPLAGAGEGVKGKARRAERERLAFFSSRNTSSCKKYAAVAERKRTRVWEFVCVYL
jgi:hypothetical protein